MEEDKLKQIELEDATDILVRKRIENFYIERM